MVENFERGELDLPQLFNVVMTYIQQRIGIVIGGTAFYSFVPAMLLIPVGFAIVGVQMSPKEMSFEKMLPVIITTMICFLLYIPTYISLRLGWIAICLKITKNETAKFSEFFNNFPFLLNFFLCNIAVVCAVSAAALLFVVPGIILGVKFSLAPYYLVDKNLGPMEALKASWETTKGHFWKIFLAYLAFFVVNMILAIIPIVGSVAQLVGVAFIDILMAAIYRDFNGDLVPAE